MSEIQVNICLGLGEAFIDKLGRELGPDTFQIRAPSGFAGANGMTQRTLAFAEENFLANRRQVIRCFDLGKIKGFNRRGQRGHLRDTQGNQGKRPQDNDHEAHDPEKFGRDEQQDHDPASDDGETDHLE